MTLPFQLMGCTLRNKKEQCKRINQDKKEDQLEVKNELC